jgi:hypothetical protein
LAFAIAELFGDTVSTVFDPALSKPRHGAASA